LHKGIGAPWLIVGHGAPFIEQKHLVIEIFMTQEREGQTIEILTDGCNNGEYEIEHFGKKLIASL